MLSIVEKFQPTKLCVSVFILNIICKIGIIVANENRLKIVLKKLNIKVNTIYFLYEGIKRFSSIKRFFIYNKILLLINKDLIYFFSDIKSTKNIIN